MCGDNGRSALESFYVITMFNVAYLQLRA